MPKVINPIFEMKWINFFLLIFFLSCTNQQAGDVIDIKKSEVKVSETENAPKLPEIEEAESTLPIEKIKLADGFKIEVFAENVENARAMAMGDKGTLFVGSRKEGKVYALLDQDKDFKADKIIIVDTDLNMPTGLAFKDGDLYVGAVSKIWKYPAIEKSLPEIPEPVLVTDAFPSDDHHGWKYLDFGPDGKLYVPVGAPCNICLKEEEIYASIARMNPDGSDIEVFAHGVRNSVGFAWHPETKELFFTENGRDWLGNEIPPCELNRAPQKGMHFGYPFCHGGTIADPEFGKNRTCNEFTKPVQNLGPHVAPLGMLFYTGSMFPNSYKNEIILAEHGSWNRDEKIGYRLMQITLDENYQGSSYKPFAEGWLDDDGKVWGRPVDVLQLSDGSMLVSDDKADAVYRITYGR